MFVVDALRSFDRRQQRHRSLSFVVAVLKKLSDDEGNSHAALIAWFGFYSLFPLLLLFVSVLGFVLAGDQSLQARIVHSALINFPVVGDQIQRNVSSVHGSGVGLVIGLVGALWAGLGITQTAQRAFNTVWGVPRDQRPDFLTSRLRGLALLALLGTATVLSTGLAALSTSLGWGGTAANAAEIVLSLAINLGVFLAAFRLLTAAPVRLDQLLPGAVLAAFFWELLQLGHGYYVTHEVSHMTAIYGVFGLVLGLLSWLYLSAHVTLIAAEVNVVRAKRLWPQALFGPQPVAPPERRDERQMVPVDRRTASGDRRTREPVYR